MSGIFLDRDGVLIRKAPEGEYIADWSMVEFLPGALEATAYLSNAGYKLIIVTNQRGVALGKTKEFELLEIHRRIRSAVANCGGHIAGIYYCPHDLSDRCRCRKPRAGMLFQGAADYGLNLAQCWIIGDAATDIGAGKSAGCKTALVTDSQDYLCWAEQPDLAGNSLATLAEQITTASIVAK